MSVVLHPLKEHDQRTLSHLLREGRLFPVLNNTKWAELAEYIRSAVEREPEFRIMSVFSVGNFVTNWDGEWQYHIHPVAEIEWLKIRGKSRDWLVSILRNHSIPFSIENETVRVWGYTRPGVQPCWQ